MSTKEATHIILPLDAVKTPKTISETKQILAILNKFGWYLIISFFVTKIAEATKGVYEKN